MNNLVLTLLGIEKRGFRVLPAERRSDGKVVAIAIRPVGVNQNRAAALGRDEETATKALYDVITRR